MSSEYESAFSDETKKYAKEYLGEDEDVQKSALDEIKTWLRKNSNLNARMDDQYILPFLRGCNYNIDKVKSKIKNYYMMRAEVPEWFSNRDPSLPEIQELVKLGVFVPLRKLHENKLVVIIRTAAHNPRIHNQNDVFKVGKMILDIAVKENEIATIYGVIAIFDMKNVTFWHGSQMTPSIIRKAVHAWQNYHCKPKQLEFINAPIYINVVLNIFKSFMSAKLKSRVRVHFVKKQIPLHEIVSENILPVEYGGNNGSLQDLCNFWAEHLVTYRDWFKDDEQYKAVL